MTALWVSVLYKIHDTNGRVAVFPLYGQGDSTMTVADILIQIGTTTIKLDNLIGGVIDEVLVRIDEYYDPPSPYPAPPGLTMINENGHMIASAFNTPYRYEFDIPAITEAVLLPDSKHIDPNNTAVQNLGNELLTPSGGLFWTDSEGNQQLTLLGGLRKTFRRKRRESARH